jgi:hypothetical protein
MFTLRGAASTSFSATALFAVMRHLIAIFALNMLS